MKPIHLLSLAAMLSLAMANAATLAVLEITIASDDEEINLAIDETKFLTDELRRQATRLLPKDYSVLTREKIISLIPETAENLNSVIDIGRAIKSDYVTWGLIGKLGGLFTLTVELYETASGNLIGDFVKESADYKGLLDAIHENAPNLFARIMPKETTPKEEPIKISEPPPPLPPPAAIPANIPAKPKKSSKSVWAAIGLDILGATVLGLGINNNSKSSHYHSECKNILKDVPYPDQQPEQYAEKEKEFASNRKKMQNAERARNIFYIGGAALLLGGVAMHIWF